MPGQLCLAYSYIGLKWLAPHLSAGVSSVLDVLISSLSHDCPFHAYAQVLKDSTQSMDEQCSYQEPSSDLWTSIRATTGLAWKGREDASIHFERTFFVLVLFARSATKALHTLGGSFMLDGTRDPLSSDGCPIQKGSRSYKERSAEGEGLCVHGVWVSTSALHHSFLTSLSLLSPGQLFHPWAQTFVNAAISDKYLVQWLLSDRGVLMYQVFLGERASLTRDV